MLSTVASSASIQNLKFRLCNPVAERHAIATLFIVTALSASIYGLMFTQPFNLIALQNRPLFDLRAAGQTDALIAWKQIAALAALGGLYWLGWHAALRVRTRAARISVLSGALIFGGLLLFMYPVGAADVFDNIMHGRILGVHNANPFQDVAAQFKNDPFFRYTAWRNSISAYGPLWETIAGATARFAGNSVVANVILFKLTLGGLLAACAALIALILRRIAPERMLAGVVLLVWNPVVLIETIGNGHNDIAMMVWVLLAAWCVLQRRYTLAVLALIGGALIKYIPLLLIPIVVALAWRDLSTRRARLRFAGVTAVIAAGVIVAAYAPFWRGLETLSIERRANLFTTSLPAVIYFQLQASVPADAAGKAVSLTAAGLTMLASLALAARAWRDRSELSFARSAFYLLMFYLLVACLWFHQWYTLWPLAVAALLPPGHAPRLAALFSYTALIKPLIMGPLLFWQKPLPPQLLRETLLGPSVMILAWLYAAYALWVTQRSKLKRKRT
jgi:hypothetical protein